MKEQKYRPSGYTLHNAVGLRRLKEMKNHLYRVKGREPVYTQEVLDRMAYDTLHEKDAVATLTTRVLPMY